MSRRYSNADPTASTAIKNADKASRIPKDRALQLAAQARTRGDEAGYAHFVAAARRAAD